MRGKLFLAVSAMALTWPLQAQAQEDAPVPQSTPEANSPNGAAVPLADPAQESGLGEIIVTAQRTEESSQRAPIPLDVVGPETLVRQNAEDEIRKAAIEDGILEQAQTNAEAYLFKFFAALGMK